MSERNLWVIESKHTDPNDFYVKVDGAEFYSAYWMVYSSSIQNAEELVLETSEDLGLGDVDIVDIQQYRDNAVVVDSEITERLRALSTKIEGPEEAQLGAWVSLRKGLW
ncbi:hypothetical protein BTA51_20045 [Hahella sp. CCB-MM4]|uniref:hypothetical protein n=1 Tax=Hahella sp. (strain CCB-MM4) TaxID=1926491 RepID=UPI000BCC52E1|nr:hypothetical protein [Hahella sp. CCB-MM4]OZG71576.1 hypothetical protein BTA51_20045 [Hahella sp. CCB-MM4]